jgi:hypothetical protein
MSTCFVLKPDDLNQIVEFPARLKAWWLEQNTFAPVEEGARQKTADCRAPPPALGFRTSVAVRQDFRDNSDFRFPFCLSALNFQLRHQAAGNVVAKLTDNGDF